MTDLINWVIANWEHIGAGALAFHGFFAVVATMTPNESDNVWADRLLKVINILGFNVGKAKNK